MKVVGGESKGGRKGFEGDDEGGGGEVEEEERERVVQFRREPAVERTRVSSAVRGREWEEGTHTSLLTSTTSARGMTAATWSQAQKSA